MKLLTLFGMSMAASYYYKNLKHNKLNFSQANFDETIKQFILRDFNS
ncbi:hypothetical protein ABLB95_06290 [Acinetobacter radioresistens]|jgi:hypothetical protein|nr:hypothetical protein [Acinetobacter radioresistens]EJO37293.1 hypothetical protein ACINWCA157_1774 [Acinetobacter radioresistens WC-A-157]MDK8754220.1 hypothetical protein [Acinetobacter radioresistens]